MEKKLWNVLLLTYVGGAYLFTWGVVIGSFYLYRQGTLSLDQFNAWYTVGAAGPTLAALLTTGVYLEKDGIRQFWSSLWGKNIERKTLLLSLSPLLLFGLGWLGYPFLAGQPYSFALIRQANHLDSPLAYAGWLLPYVTYALFEELGWRGFLLPLLQHRFPAFKATLILTGIWGVWHAPFWLFRFEFSLFTVFGFLFSLLVGAVILSHLYNQSGGSVLLAILFHLTNNLTSALDKQYIVAVLSVGFLGVALFLITRYGRTNLANRPRVHFLCFQSDKPANLTNWPAGASAAG